MANPKKRRKFFVFSAIIVVLAGLTLVAIFKKRKPVITVQTEKVTLRNITETVIANGQIQPVKQVVISPEVAGEITALPVKEGDRVKKGDLLVQIKPDNYIASRNSADAQYKSAIASKELAKAQLVKAETEYNRNQELFSNKLISASAFLDFKTQYEVAKLQYENAIHLEDQAKFGLDKAKDDLSKTTIVAPMDGTITRLESQPGERVLGTSFNMGTEIMTISDLNEMEALVDIGEMDVVLLKPGQKARLDVDAFKDRKFSGVITEIAISAKGSGLSAAQAANNSSQEATKFEAHIRVNEKDNLRPGMSVTAEIETRSRTNVLAVPIASVTMRIPKQSKADGFSANAEEDTNSAGSDKKSKEPPKQEYVVFVVEGDHVKMRPVKIGISDDDYYEITEGLKEGEKVVSGSYRAINHDLNDGTKITETGSNRRRKKL
jgi:HlyD family secretion protein